ncbi:integrase core domain-containing protein (plasmid) [Streptomyces sp. BHT-5-2]|uniref:integrase core domain-containing protein n=1 Tax=Streptomyces sp. BHT-5-2 TaxID=2866715 RepID=UPI001C8EF1F5|nr:integrase core domain-containing protein [Streptomyces sp. BHT-5-2]
MTASPAHHAHGPHSAYASRAFAESFNATCKRETLPGRRAFADEREARLSLFRWLHRYNTVRRHSSLGHRSPIAFETALDTPSTTPAQPQTCTQDQWAGPFSSRGACWAGKKIRLMR